MLHCDFYPASGKRKGETGHERLTLVFLHGLLGSGPDWQDCLRQLEQFDRMTVDLPGHGLSCHIGCDSLDDCCQQLQASLAATLPASAPLVLVGYSLGGRVIMHGIARQCFAHLNIRAAVIEGGNFGLQTESDKAARWKNDTLWAGRFANEPLERVLADWYQQPVFSSLNHEQRQTLIAKRSDNLGPSIAKMLLATSLAKQDDLLPQLRQQSLPIEYICGGKDIKFSQIAQSSGLAYRQVDGAGHNVHQEQPLTFAAQVNDIIFSHFGSENNQNNGNHHGKNSRHF